MGDENNKVRIAKTAGRGRAAVRGERGAAGKRAAEWEGEMILNQHQTPLKQWDIGPFRC